MPRPRYGATCLAVSCLLTSSALGARQPSAAATVEEGRRGAAIPIQEGCEKMEPLKALEEMRRAYVAAFNGGDAAAVAALHTEQAVHLPAGMPPVRGRAAIREILEASLSRMPEGARFEFEPVEVRVAEGWAVERGVTAAAAGFPSGKYAMLYEKESDGCWRIAWAITNSDAPPPGTGDR